MQLVCVVGPLADVPPGTSGALADLDLRLVEHLGGRWDDPPAPPSGWHTDPALDPLVAHARDALAGRDPVVVDDPLAALVLPFWARIAADASADLTAAVVLVAPERYARGLADRAGVAPDVAADLWLRYTVTAYLDAPDPLVVAPGAADLDGLPDRARAAVDRYAGVVAAEGGAEGAGAALARAVHDLITGGGEARPLLAALRSGWQAADRARRDRERLTVLRRAEQEARERSGRLQADADRLAAQLRAVEERWSRTAREAIVGEHELARANQQLQGQLHRLRDELAELARAHDRLRRRRAVRYALALDELVRPAVERLRGRRPAPGPTPTAAAAETTRPAATVFTVVLNYRHTEDTLRCVAALAASTDRDQRLVVVDNGSGVDHVEQLRAALLAAAVLDAGDNLGYAAGNNLGIRHALDRGADLVWILNPDTRVEADTLARLLATAAEHPDAGIVGARLLTGDSDPVTIESDGGIIDGEAGGATSHRNAGARLADVPPGGPHEVDYVSGACMLVRRAVFDTVGLLPEEWFLYFEETDFTVGAHEAGWRVLVDPRARVWHHKRSSGRVPSPYYVYYFVRNRLRFARIVGADGDEPPPDLKAWIEAWRAKVADADPDWVATFDQLVERALDDARSGVTGRRPDVEQVTPSRLSRA